MRKVLRNEDCDALDEARKHLKTLTPEQRSAYIDKNGDRWTALRAEFWRFGDHKCWYSEAPVNEQCGQIEHFRPKKRLHGLEKGSKHQGYWWLAFDWENYRLSSQVCNIRVTDYLSGKKVGKGSYFPLRDEGKRAASEGEEKFEDNVLLDPCNNRDVRLISFCTESGKPLPTIEQARGGVELTDDEKWKKYRAEQTIDYFHLDEGSWNTDRKDLMDEVAVLCNKIIDEEKKVGKSPEYYDLIDELNAYFEKHEPFTAAVRQVLKEKNLVV
ncbi:hypothetical protein AB4353_16140 [Vibrio breoganii]